MGRYDKFSICTKCFDIIVMRKPGSMVWKLYGVEAKHDKAEHEACYEMESWYDARKIKKKIRELYWEIPEEKRRNWSEEWPDLLEKALKDLNYVTSKGGKF